MTDRLAYRIRLVGVTHAPGYPGNLLDLVERLAHQPALPADLVRDLDNADDLNATALHLEGRHLGHLPREIAAEIAPLIDAGVTTRAAITRVAVDLDHRHRPGLDVLVTAGPIPEEHHP